jgi:hypothetical protein
MNNDMLFPFDPSEDGSDQEQVRRWRLILGKEEGQSEADSATSGMRQPGGEAAEGQGEAQPGGEEGLSEQDQAIDDALNALYGDEGGLGDASPDIARWLGDIQRYFPQPVAQLMEHDALKRLNLQKLLAQPELLAQIEPDLDLVTRILALSKVLPVGVRETARQVVRQVVDAIIEKLDYPLRQAIQGSINRAQQSRRPRRASEINWLHTIRVNLKHYQPKQRTIVPERIIGFSHQRHSLRDVILCIDQSASMAKSIVYASIFGSVLASLPALSTKLVLFSTDVVDLTEKLEDPVDLLFGIRLGGGTNINRALAYCQGLVTRPRDTIMVLISDLYEGGSSEGVIRRAAALTANGVQIIVLLALNDQGAPRFNRQLAQELVNLGIPSFACTPDLFPDMMSAAISGHDIKQWAASNNIVTAPSN